MIRALPVFHLCLLVASAASAQPSPVSPGETVRLESRHVNGRFDVVAVSAEMLTVRDTAGAVAEVPWESIEGLSRSRGQRSSGQGFLRGFGFGSLGGASAGILLGLASGDDPPGTFIQFSAGEKALVAGAALGIAGGLAGGFIGALAPGEQWERVSLTGAVVGAGAGRAGLQYSIRF